jgi:unsaturated rhamnogalacturonyl hydrolase
MRLKLIQLLVVIIFTSTLANAQSFSDSVINYGMDVKVAAAKYGWGWSQAVFLQSVHEKYEGVWEADKKKYFAYIKTAMDINYTNANGRTPNDIVSGLGMAFLARVTKEEKYKQKALAIYDDYQHIIKTKNGGVSHRANIAQLWDDTIYMLAMYLFEMYKLTGDTKYLDDFMQQYNIHKAVLRDKKTGFWVHGWNAEDREYDDSCCMIGWDKNAERKNHEFWGRGNGWIMMTIVDALNTIPKTSPNWQTLKTDFVKMTANLPALQNKVTGHWYQLPIHPKDSLNYQESSCTAMFGYAIMGGLKLKILNKKIFAPVVNKAYYGLREHSIRVENNKYLVPTNICTGTCIGDKDYYYHRKIVEGNDFGIGVFAMFAQAYELGRGTFYTQGK